MVGFGRRIINDAYDDWSCFYINYEKLKQILFKIETLKTPSELNSLAEEFSSSLEFEINKAAAHYHALIEDIGHKMRAIRTKWPYLHPDNLEAFWESSKAVATMMHLSIEFVGLNSEGVRKILKKAEKITHLNLMKKDRKIKELLRPDNFSSKFDQLRIHKGFELLVYELRDRTECVKKLERQALRAKIISESFVHKVHAQNNTEELLVKIEEALHHIIKETAWYYGLLSQAMMDYEKEPIGKSSRLGIILNNYNTFLYMVNYYVVVPSANIYATKVGLSPSASGAILAMAPLSALFASVFYSYWSNKSFRSPLIFCSILLISGNILYSLALPYNSPMLLFIGRLLVGLGGNRAVNRRYLVDFVDQESRFFHSAVFVAVGSLGMTVGPGLQWIFNRIDFSIPYFGWPVNGLTASGWLMSLLWFLFFMKMWLLFEEPIRRQPVPVGETSLIEPFLPTQDQLNEESNFALFKIAPDKEGTVICLLFYFVLKFVQEAFQAGAPLVTNFYFDWNDDEIGFMLAFLGILTLPVNILVGCFSYTVQDTTLQSSAAICMIFGFLVTINITNYIEYSDIQFVLGATIMFLSAQVLEAANMSLLSKVMPKLTSTGILNSGFLSTEAGTSGRVMGNMWVTLCGSFLGLSVLQNFVSISSIAATMFVLLLSRIRVYALQPVDARLRSEGFDIVSKEEYLTVPELQPKLSKSAYFAEKMRTHQTPSLGFSRLAKLVGEENQACYFLFVPCVDSSASF
eukprot:GHVP01069088.1.p1 GENE.GHVP01069088.1~~GHVP01069088.1.p1  ORF type:complete len:745 (-),score=103.17 GHVP01069088.1:2338-4572(-)